MRHADRRLVIAVLIALAGFLAHNAREFGWAGLLDPVHFSIPLTLIWVVLTVVWLRKKSIRPLVSKALFCLASLNILGAIVTVLPLEFLPFEPEQSVSHYLSHLVYGGAQAPLLFLLRTPFTKAVDEVAPYQE